MGKKKNTPSSALNRIKIEVKDEIADNDVHVARDRLKGALRELLRISDEESTADSADEAPIPEIKPSRRTPKLSSAAAKKVIRRRRPLPSDQLFHHTYVMKLFDRSVDLAQFTEETPLYPICRAWLANQPRNPNAMAKARSPSPEIISEPPPDDIIEDENGDLKDVYALPIPLPRMEVFPRNRIPSPIPQPVDEFYLDYEGVTLKSRETLMKDHREHWSLIRRKWHQQAHKNEKRFFKSAHILNTIFKRAQTEFE